MEIKTNKSHMISEDTILNLCVYLLCVSSMLQYSVLFNNYSTIYIALKYAIPIFWIILLIIRIKNKQSLLEITTSTLLLAIACATSISTNNFSYTLVVLFLIMSKRLSINTFIRNNLRVLIVMSIIHIALWGLNCIVHFGFPVFYNEVERRIAFLFTHPNIAALKMGWGVIMYTWLHWNVLNKYRIVGCWCFVLFLYVTTKSDACLLFLFYLLLINFKDCKLLNEMTIYISKYIFFLLGAINVILAKLYLSGNHIIMIIDSFFSRRLAMGYLAIEDYGYTLFGREIDMSHEWSDVFNFGNYTIDSLYIYFFVCIGLFYFILISIGFWKLGEYKSYKVAIVIITFSLYCLIEVHCLYLANCFALFFLKTVLFNEKELELK